MTEFLELLQVDDINDSGDFGCVIDRDIIPEENWRHYVFVMVMLQYVLPLSAITFTYGHMAKVRRSKRTTPTITLGRFLGASGNLDSFVDGSVCSPD